MENDIIQDHTAKIIVSYVANNSIAPQELPDIIYEVGLALRTLDSGAPVVAPVKTKLVPAVPIAKSVTPDYIICLESGRKFKSLKRHLNEMGMTPVEYRNKWGLPYDYPLTAANYAAQRSALAKQFGLGKSRGSKVKSASR